MRQLARHHRMVVGILRLMVSFCVVHCLEILHPSFSLAGSLKASWNANTEQDLAGYKIYYGLSSGNYTASINVGKATQYTINQITEGVPYYFAITAYDTAGNESNYSPEVSAKILLADVIPPAVSSVAPRDQSTLEIKFSEAVSSTSALNKANYVIDNGITILNAVFQPGSSNIVILSTRSHETGKTYKITIQKISDRATPANVMPQALSFNYTYQAEDRQPPEVNSVTITDLTHLLVIFNEPVTPASAQNVNNYRLSDNIQAQEARLASNGVEVTLVTSLHQYNKDYNLTIINIKDRSAAANTISANSTFTYFLVNNNDNNSGLSVNGLNPARYTVDTLQVGEAYYIDRPYVIRQIPNNKRGLIWIKTANADRTNNAERFLEFTLTRESNLYVAYDNRALQPPNWLKDNFTDTGEFIMVSESAGKLNLWKSRYLPGRVSLGGNMASGVQTTTSLSMYVVMIEDAQSAPNTDAAAPQNFVLRQNYPNPFSRSGGALGRGQTKIEYYLKEQHSVTLTVHNAIGQIVRKLYNGLLPAGTHNATWDGRDENGKLLPSGTYLCTLEVRDEVNNAGIAMTASLNRQTRVMTLLK